MEPTQDDIRLVTDLLVKQFQPRKVILFGSRAYGTARPDSDVDLLIILPFDCSTYSMMSSMFSAIYPMSGFDLMARTPEDVAKRYSWGDPFVKEAIDRGIVLYEAAA